MNQYQCKQCENRYQSVTPPKVCESCKNTTFDFIETICYLVPAETLPEHHVIHTSLANLNHVQDFVDKDLNGKKWVTACNKIYKPKVTTNFAAAVTCPRCITKIREMYISQLNLPAQPNPTVPNPFKKRIDIEALKLPLPEEVSGPPKTESTNDIEFTFEN